MDRSLPTRQDVIAFQSHQLRRCAEAMLEVAECLDAGGRDEAAPAMPAFLAMLDDAVGVAYALFLERDKQRRERPAGLAASEFIAQRPRLAVVDGRPIAEA